MIVKNNLTLKKKKFSTVVNENVSLVISRSVLTDVSLRLQQLPDETSKAVSHYTLDKVNNQQTKQNRLFFYLLLFKFIYVVSLQVQPRVISFEEQVASIRQHLADIYERNQVWKEAANVLVGIPLETGQKYY